jgi:hypothetical protein
MTCSLVTPWWRRRRGVGSATGGVAVTRVLDWDHPAVRSLVARVDEARPADLAALLRVAHQLIVESVRPVYSVNELRPISRTLGRGRGSCSQRLALLEGVARASGIGTRVRGLLVDGRFWYPRFPRLRLLVPNHVILAWPEFHLPAGWVSASEVYGPLGGFGTSSGFTNAGETLFDAIATTAVDWDGVCQGGACDLSATVLADLGHFDSREALFHAHGQTLCWPLTTLADPVLSRWAPS